MNEKKTYLPTYKGCIICGQKETNPNTMNLRFEVTDKGVQVPFTPGKRQEGYKDVVHGGIICSLLDETIGWAIAVERKKIFVTGELNVRFVRSLPVGTAILVKGWSVEHKSRYSIGKGEIIDANGTVYAKGSGKYFFMPEQYAKEVNKYLTFREGDLDVLAEERRRENEDRKPESEN